MIPTSSRTDIAMVRRATTIQAVVVTAATSSWGWTSWMTMNSSPAATADRPAPRLRLVVVMDMSLLPGLWHRGRRRGMTGT